MNTDRELLEAAAKVAGIEGHFQNDGADSGLFLYDPANPFVWKPWNPLTDDADAFRLAVKLNLHDAIRMAHRLVDAQTDFYAATRRSIVRAAAALGSPK